MGNELTTEQREIAALVAQGLTNAKIARKRYMSQANVEQHLSRIYHKLGFISGNKRQRLTDYWKHESEFAPKEKGTRNGD